MTNPYEVLGIERGAEIEEIKNAYRKLALDCHGDESKMRKLDDAYDQIMREINNGPASYSAGSGNKSSENSGSFSDIRKLISAGRLDDADQILDGVSGANRNAEWHFLKGTVFYRRGWMDKAYNHFETAAAREPDNLEYNAIYSQMKNQRSGSFGGYNTGSGQTYGGHGGNCDICDVCCALMCMDSICKCMSGRF